MLRPESALETLTREELGLSRNDLGSPWVAAGSSFAAFAVGALVPVLPFLFGSGAAAVAVSVLLSAVALLAVGGLIALLTGRDLWRTALRQLVVAGVPGVASFSIGRLIGNTV